MRFVGEREWRTVVGVVADVRAYDLTRTSRGGSTGTSTCPCNANATLEGGRLPVGDDVTLGSAADEAQLGGMFAGWSRRSAATWP